MDKRKGITLFALLTAVMLALASPTFADNTVRLCTSKTTSGHCPTYNETAGHGRLFGHKTIAVKITGTASVTATCIIGNDEHQTSFQIDTFASTDADEFDTNCSDIDVEVNTCSSCSVDAWLGSEG